MRRRAPTAMLDKPGRRRPGQQLLRSVSVKKLPILAAKSRARDYKKPIASDVNNRVLEARKLNQLPLAQGPRVDTIGTLVEEMPTTRAATCIRGRYGLAPCHALFVPSF